VTIMTVLCLRGWWTKELCHHDGLRRMLNTALPLRMHFSYDTHTDTTTYDADAERGAALRVLHSFLRMHPMKDPPSKWSRFIQLDDVADAFSSVPAVTLQGAVSAVLARLPPGRTPAGGWDLVSGVGHEAA